MCEQYRMVRDAWLKELEEAMEIADVIDARIRERDSILGSGGDPSRLISATRRKITILATSLDRLESLLHNPPAKPHLNEKELCRRHDMLLGIRFKAKQMAASLSTQSQKSRIDVGQDSSNSLSDTERTSSIVPQNFTGLQKQNMGGLENLGTMVVNTKHIAVTIDENQDLQRHLLCDLNEGAELSETQLKKSTLNDEESSRNRFGLFCLWILGILALILIVWTVIKIV